MSNPHNLNHALCSKCGGACCKNMPGAASPEDFPTPELLIEALASGHWAVDWWEGDARPEHDELDRTYYLHPATKDREGQRFDGSWGGECTFLTQNGCSLMPADRPAECRATIPDKAGCKQTNGTDKQAMAVAWISRAHELTGDAQ